MMTETSEEREYEEDNQLLNEYKDDDKMYEMKGETLCNMTMPVRRAVINEDYHYGSQCNNMKGTRIIDYHGPDGPGRRQNCCIKALNRAATRSADLLRRSFRCLISQNESQKSYLQDAKITSIGDAKAKILDTKVRNPAQERKIISMRWLTMALTIIRLENYVRKCRTLKTTPDRAKLNESCTCILTM